MQYKLESIDSALFTALEHSDARSMIGAQTQSGTVITTVIGQITDAHPDLQYDGPA